MEIEIKKIHKDVDCLGDAFAQFLEEEFYDTFVTAMCDWIKAFERHSKKCHKGTERVDTLLYESCNETVYGGVPDYVEFIPMAVADYYEKACSLFFQKYPGEVYFYRPDLDGLEAEAILPSIIDYEIYGDWSLNVERRIWKMPLKEAAKLSKKEVNWDTIVTYYESNLRNLEEFDDYDPSLYY